jgi:hypothetical protein
MLFRRTTAFLLLVAFFAQAFNRYLLVFDYYVNPTVYIANCVNKDRPWMHCNGRCQLCKKLHQQDNTEDRQIPERRPGNGQSETLFRTASFIDFTTLQLVTTVTRRFPEIAAAKPVRMPRSLFHPPGDHLD